MKDRHSLKRFSALLMLAALVLGSAAGAANLPLPAAEATSSINVRDLKRHLNFLASSELGGRYTFSTSGLIAARYLAAQLEDYGYRGAARDGSFFQQVPLSYRNVDLASSRLTLNAGGAAQEFRYPQAFIAEVPTNFSLSGQLVFVGQGISSPKNDRDDYAGLKVAGKIVVVMEREPIALNNVKLADDEQGQSAALAHGAIGMIKIPDAQNLLTWEQLKIWYGGQQQLSLPPKASASGKSLPEITAGPDLIRAIAKAMGKQSSDLIASTVKFAPVEIAASADIKLRVEVKDAERAQNVAATLEGSDPKLRDEYVVFSAHYDHLKTTDKGEVYHGADDDGSGTVSVLEIAQALSLARPRRSVLIVFHTAEELGLFGSEYNTDYEPVVPLAKLVADFNIDMVGRSRVDGNTDPRDVYLTDKDSIYIIGADRHSTELNELSEQTNRETARLKFNYMYNDEKHPERFYYRSDHYNYAKHGIPIIFYFTGVHRDYHKPTDVVDKIDFVKMERIARMIFATGWRVANLDHKLVVDKHR